MIRDPERTLVRCTVQKNLLRRGVTLIELLVVIGIIALMVTLLLPAVHLVQQAARHTACDNNLGQLTLGLSQYMDLHRGYPPLPPIEDRPSGWALAILLFVEEQPLYDMFDPDVLFLAPVNKQAALHRPAIFFCPVVAPTESTMPLVPVTNYVLIVDSKDPRRKRSVYLMHGPEESHFPWCPSPEILQKELNFPPAHGGPFGL